MATAALGAVRAHAITPPDVAGARDAVSPTYVVRMPGAVRGDVAALQLDPVVQVDYGTFLWLVLTADGFARLHGSGLPYAAPVEPYTLRLGARRFDPLVQPPDLPPGWSRVRDDGPDLHLVQFVGPTRAAWVDALKAGGLEVVQYIHPFTYIVWGDVAERDAAAASGAVRWTGPFAPAYRVLPPWRNLPAAPLRVNVLLYRGADTDAAVTTLAALSDATAAPGQRVAPPQRRVLNATFEVVGMTLPGTAVQAAAHVPGVYSIQPVPTDGGLRTEMSDQINVNNHDADNLAFPGYLDWLAAVGVDGAGVIIANVDGGIQNNHPDLVGRLLACTGQTCGGGATSSHGTHTAGIMAADGASGTLDAYGFLRGLGQAPGANLVEQVYAPWFQQPGGMLLLMTDSYNNGASLSGNSWGPSGSPQGYDNDTMQVDIGVRDADPDAPGNQPLTFVLSFMNGNGGTSTQGTPDEAKNIFNIGSTKMQTGGGAQILDINDLSSNTAHGPALDGRTIPHLVAPGCLVDSTTSGSGYTLMCGTSMASPHVSGAVAVFIEYYRNLSGQTGDPSPAMIKAAFLPVAHDLAGYDDADGNTLGHPFDSKQGWGRLDLDAVVHPTLSPRYFDNPVVLDNTGEEWVTTLSPVDPAQPMRIMLVWTDAPGHGLGGATPAWNNDLDLVVQAGGDTFYGNRFGPDGWSQTGGVPDFKNNTEGVFLGPAAPGAVTVRVIAANINSDGVPNDGDDTDQDFALVCYNAALEPGFSITVTPSNMAVCAPDAAAYEIQIAQIMGFTDPVTLSASGAPSGTVVTFTTNPVIPPGTSTM
ncbi:MAG: S8 family serine peptidase, partial [Phycisphaerae bacterium]